LVLHSGGLGYLFKNIVQQGNAGDDAQGKANLLGDSCLLRTTQLVPVLIYQYYVILLELIVGRLKNIPGR
jgi:hypothetical protein